jgi:hypothetical protein
MARKQKWRKRKDVKRLLENHCCDKFDKFNELYFSDSLHETDYEQHWLVPPVCKGGFIISIPKELVTPAKIKGNVQCCILFATLHTLTGRGYLATK